MYAVSRLQLGLVIFGDDSNIQPMVSPRDPRKRSLFSFKHAHQFPVHVGMNVVALPPFDRSETDWHLIAPEHFSFIRRQYFNARPSAGLSVDTGGIFSESIFGIFIMSFMCPSCGSAEMGIQSSGPRTTAGAKLLELIFSSFDLNSRVSGVKQRTGLGAPSTAMAICPDGLLLCTLPLNNKVLPRKSRMNSLAGSS